MSTEQENPYAGAAEQHPVAHSTDGSIVGTGGDTAGTAHQYQDLPVMLRQILNVLIAPNAPARNVILNLSPEERLEIVRQRGQRSDQSHNFRKWLLVAAGLAFFLILLTTVGLVVFLTLQDEVAFASEIVAGVFGLISGLVTGVGGTLGFIALRQWLQ